MNALLTIPLASDTQAIIHFPSWVSGSLRSVTVCMSTSLAPSLASKWKMIILNKFVYVESTNKWMYTSTIFNFLFYHFPFFRWKITLWKLNIPIIKILILKICRKMCISNFLMSLDKLMEFSSLTKDIEKKQFKLQTFAVLYKNIKLTNCHCIGINMDLTPNYPLFYTSVTNPLPQKS